MNRDGYETAWTGPGESITGNGTHDYECDDMLGYTEDENACQIAFRTLAQLPGTELQTPSCGPRLHIKRKITDAGQLSDGIRAFIVTPCLIWRWITVTHGWDTIAELDQRDYWNRPADLARAVLDAIDSRTPPAYRTELTPIGVRGEALGSFDNATCEDAVAEILEQ